MNDEERAALRAEFLRQAAAQFEEMFDPDRQENLRTFVQRDDRSWEAGQALARWMLEHHVGGDEKAGEGPAKSPCPLCGEEIDAQADADLLTREVVGRGGKIEMLRSGRICSSCRKHFFPSGP